MARESLTINGWDLMDGTYRDTEVVTFRSPAPVGENPTVAGRTGSVPRRKRHGPSGFRVTMWVGHPTEARSAVQDRWGEVIRVVNQPHDTATVVWTRSDGSTRTCEAELTGEIEPTAIGQRGYRGQLEFTIPGAYWWGANGSVGPATGTVNLTWLAGATAPLEHLSYAFSSGGPVTVTAPSTGDSFTYDGAATGVTVDSGAWTVTGGDPSLLTYTGTRFLTVAPGLPSSTPQIVVSGGNVTVSGKVAYQ